MFLMRITELDKAYLAGFMDGDGSIYVRLKRNDDYHFGFQVSPWVVFFQSSRENEFLERLRRKWGKGYIRERKDGVSEWVIGDVKAIKETLSEISHYLRLKRKQAKLLLSLLKIRKKVNNGRDFLKLAQLIDEISKLNHSKTKKIDSSNVKRILQKKHLLTP